MFILIIFLVVFSINGQIYKKIRLFSEMIYLPTLRGLAGIVRTKNFRINTIV